MVKGESHIPKLRFKGFSDVWKQKKLSEISSRVQEKNKDNQVTETFTNSAERGIINQRDFFDKDISNEANLDNYYIVQPDDFVYNPRISNFAPVGPIKRNKLGRLGVMSPLYSVFRPDSNLINLDYLEHYFSTTNWHKFMFTHGDQGARSDRFAIGMATFQKMPISLPFLKEQTQIGNFFQKIDQVIELQQKALDTARDYKKSMLQKMFPQKGEKVPQIRFDGFSGDWEMDFIEKILQINSGKDYKHLSEGDIPVYGTGGYMLSVNEALSEIDAIGLGRKGSINNPQFLNAPFWTVDTLFFLTPKKEVAINFSFYLVSQINWMQYDESTGVPSLSKKTIEKVKVMFPKLDEQQKIGMFFQKLDQRIEQHEKKLESYQNLKKAMLQRLFV